MKKLNLLINVKDLKMENADNEKIMDTVINNIEQAIASSYQDQANPRKPITNDEQRKINRLMDKLEEHKNGIIELSDTMFALLLARWNKKQLPVLTGQIRKVYDRIDKIICEDDFKEEKDELAKKV